MIEGFYRSWDLYTTGQLVDGLQQKKKTVFIKGKWNHVVFSRDTILSFHHVCEKKDKYLNLARELKNLWTMKVSIVPIVIGALGTVSKGLSKGLENLKFGGWVETFQTTTLLRTARILRRVLGTLWDLL